MLNNRRMLQNPGELEIYRGKVCADTRVMKHKSREHRSTTGRWAKPTQTMKLTSPAFDHGQTMPPEYSSGSLNKNPPLIVEAVPGDAKKLVLVMDENETARGILTHWIIFNIEPKIRFLSEDCVPSSAQMGANSWGECCYEGLQPVSDEHQYFFRLYALDCELNLPQGASRAAVEKAMKGHIISEAVLMARFSVFRQEGKFRP